MAADSIRDSIDDIEARLEISVLLSFSVCIGYTLYNECSTLVWITDSSKIIIAKFKVTEGSIGDNL